MEEETRNPETGDPVTPPVSEPQAPSSKPEVRSHDRDLTYHDEVAHEIGIVVKTILDLVGIRTRVEVEKSGGEYYANIRPQMSKGLLIGRKGGTLKSIQYLTRLIIKRKFPELPPVMVDVGGYRLRRESFLRKKAEAVARIVSETHREMALDTLTDKEKAMIEDHLKSIPNVRVYSVMTGSKQNVIIAPKATPGANDQ